MSNWFSKDIDLAVAAQLKQHFQHSPKTKHPFVTVSRMYGCDGIRTAALIAEKLNKLEDDNQWAVVSREKLLEAAEGGLSNETLTELERFGHSEMKSYIRNAIFGMGNLADTVKQVSKIIQLFAERGRVVFLGGGASIITQDIENGVHIQLYAPETWRVENHRKRWSINAEEALRKVQDESIDREAWVKTFLGENLYDERFYDLVINNQRINAEEASDLAVALVKQRMA